MHLMPLLVMLFVLAACAPAAPPEADLEVPTAAPAPTAVPTPEGLATITYAGFSRAQVGWKS